jgi:hypothetical protein
LGLTSIKKTGVYGAWNEVQIMGWAYLRYQDDIYVFVPIVSFNTNQHKDQKNLRAAVLQRTTSGVANFSKEKWTHHDERLKQITRKL